MIYTARQLQDLHKGNGHLVLPYGARLTPLAADWARSKKLAIGYSNVEAAQAPASTVEQPVNASVDAKPLLWWCDGPCGAAKAAITAQSKESSLAAIELPTEPTSIVKAVKHVASQVRASRASGGVFLVQTGAAAVVYANRCSSLRAVLGTCLEAVEQGLALVAANVLVIEYPHKTLSQIKNMLGRFARAGQRQPSEDVQRQLQELSSCG